MAALHQGALGKARNKLLSWLLHACDPVHNNPTTRAKAVKALGAVVEADPRTLGAPAVQTGVHKALQVSLRCFSCFPSRHWTALVIDEAFRTLEVLIYNGSEGLILYMVNTSEHYVPGEHMQIGFSLPGRTSPSPCERLAWTCWGVKSRPTRRWRSPTSTRWRPPRGTRFVKRLTSCAPRSLHFSTRESSTWGGKCCFC